MEAPIRETQRDVQNHLRRGSEYQAQGRLIDALTEFGQGWQKALTLPLKFNWRNDERTERYSEHLEKRLDGVVRGTSLRVVSDATEKESIIVAAELSGVRNPPYPPLEKGGKGGKGGFSLTATYIEGGGKLRSSNGQEGTSVNIVTGDNGQAEVFIQERGKSIQKNRVLITLDKAHINPLYSLIGQDRVSALLAKEVVVSLSEPQTYRVAVLPFENLRQDTEMDWIARYLQSTLTDKLTQAKSIEVLARIDIPAILKELDLQMSDLVDPRSAKRIGRMQGATHVVTGTYTPIEPCLQISARLVDVEKGSVELSAEEEGDVIKAKSQLSVGFFEIAGNLAFSLASQLDPTVDKIPPTPLFQRGERGDFDEHGDSELVDPTLEIFKRALLLQEEGQIDEAIDLYKSGLQQDPNRAEAYNNLGICYGKKKQIHEARESYEMAIRLKPRFPEVYNNLGWLLLETGDTKHAIEQFQKGLELVPKTFAQKGNFEVEQRERIWTNLAWAYHVKGDYKKAIETNEAILQEHPLALYPRYNLALAHLRNGNINAAEEEYKTAYNQTSRPDEPAYRSAVDDLQNLLKNGIRPREAQQMLEILEWRK
ncbi:TPA: tetratricopeptide repeat protein [Candidatus Poribacteria bacterium]|nr:tetratricopeptide repeat protein [Candidatus Poribacteria bacterium]